MENTVSQKLEQLLALQLIDSNLNEIKKSKIDLSEEVSELEDEIVGFETRAGKFNEGLSAIESEIKDLKNVMKDSNVLIKKYNEQQMKVKNNREYQAITKEIELQELEVQLAEKKIKEVHAKTEQKNTDIKDTDKLLKERKEDLKGKQDELKVITNESQVEEEKLFKKRKKVETTIDERMLLAYTKIKNNARNGLAVVTVQRDACGGCFNSVPPQRQVDIREKKKIIVCEHCGRIFADVELVVEVKKIKKTRRVAAIQ